MTFAAEVERVWPGRGASFEVLGGGITNHNLKVEVDGERFVLRVAGKDTGLLGIDRTVELAATQAAAALGIGPEVVEFVEPEGWLVTRFVEGEIPALERMREPAMLARVARAVRAFHDSDPIPGSFDSFRVVEIYRQTALEGCRKRCHEPSKRLIRSRAGCELLRLLYAVQWGPVSIRDDGLVTSCQQFVAILTRRAGGRMLPTTRSRKRSIWGDSTEWRTAAGALIPAGDCVLERQLRLARR